MHRLASCLWIVLTALPVHLYAVANGSIQGTVTDQSGALIPGAKVMLELTAQHSVFETATDNQGFYSFPALPPGTYDLIVSAEGFQTQRKTGLTVDMDSAVRVDLMLQVGARAESVTVSSDTELQVETVATHLGEVVTGNQLTALPLNGRSYTDLLAIQPGVAPVSTLLPSSVIMAGVTGSLDPSGDLNPGNLSINGQRESSNGFLVDGIDVQEHMNGGTSIIPDLDSIDEFRVLTNNFDSEYGNYNGGIITVATKAGTDNLHGDAFEFLRNTALDARGYFDPTRSAFQQNQFGGTLGGPLQREKVFLFGDYQGTRTNQGVSTNYITVPTLAERSGQFNDLTGCVSGPYFASLLSQELGTTIQAGDPYSAASPIQSSTTPKGCTPDRPTVFNAGAVPGSASIPKNAWSATGKALLAYIPSPNVTLTQFSTSAYAQTVRDDKSSARADANTRIGQVSGYYFIDHYNLDNPYPGSVAGASIPGFDALYIGQAQLFSFGDSKLAGAKGVNEFHLGYLRNADIIGQPKGGLGVSLSAQEIANGAGGAPGIYIQAPQFEGVENITFPTFTMGLPITNLTQTDNTYYVSDGFSRLIGTHTLKFGAQFHFDQINEHPNATFNGTFNMNGTETGDPYADFLLGIASNFTQSSGQPFYLRNRYFGSYVEDSYHALNNLTVNIGTRWDIIMPFWEKYNQIQTWVSGAQSTLYPGALPGLLVAGDPGIPRTLAPTQYGNIVPRIGLAWAPRFSNGLGKALLGSDGKGSLRASYGVFYTQFPGLAAGIMYAVPPFGYNYLSPAPPLMATPFISAATGVDNGQRFPFAFPPHNISASHPDSSINWANFAPLSADPFFDIHNRVPYVGDYMFSVQRQITDHALLTVSYVGNQGHRIPAVISVNPGNPSLCLSLPGCKPFAEDNDYTTSGGQTIYGTREGQSRGAGIAGSEIYGENTDDTTIANSNYNALETTLRYQRDQSKVLLSYDYSKSIDQGSNIGEQLDPLNPRQSRAISTWDQRQTFVGSYDLALPIQQLVGKTNSLSSQWSLSGTTRFASGFPVTLYDNSDNSLLGTLGNGVNNYLLDTPQRLPGPLKINTNGRNRKPAFNTALFPEENPGQLGDAKRRSFYGPGIENFDLTLQKNVTLAESRSLEFRVEAFNAFNHAQFYGPASVDGQVDDPNFGQIVSAASPRLLQLVAKFAF